MIPRGWNELLSSILLELSLSVFKDRLEVEKEVSIEGLILLSHLYAALNKSIEQMNTAEFI